MEVRNLAWHRLKTSRILNHDTTSPDQDFAGPSNDQYQKLDEAINEALSEERNLALQEGSREPFKEVQHFTWPSGDVTFALPSIIDRGSIVSIHDVTNDAVGIPLYVSPRWANRKIFFLDNGTLQWATTGPGADVTLEISYVAEPPVLVNPSDEATLIPYNHRHLINWSAAIILVGMADQKVPDFWITKQSDLRSQFHLALARGVPSEYGVPRTRNHRTARFR